MSDTFDPIAFLSVVSGDGDWSDEFLAWYEPGKWLSDERACGAFLAGKFAELQADARRYRAFIAAGLPVCFLGVEYHTQADLDAAIDGSMT